MASVTRIVALILIALGLGGWLATGRSSPTALIPAAVGVVLELLGLWARNPDRRKLAMHLAMLVALVGIAGAARGLPKLPALLRGDEVERPIAIWMQTAMVAVCAVYLLLGIRSFIAARRS